jgi:hypothetical protein
MTSAATSSTVLHLSSAFVTKKSVLLFRGRGGRERKREKERERETILNP